MAHGGGSPLAPVKGFVNWFEKFGIEPIVVFIVFGIGMFIAVFFYIDVPTSRWLGLLFASSPVWLPILLFFEWHHAWLEYVRKYFDIEYGRTTLEIQFPQDVFKSPAAMELVLVQMYQTATPDNYVETYWDGKHPPTYGLELVSDGGKIHFYINCPTKKYKNIVEAQLYAQYPGIIVTALPLDYTAEVNFDLDKWPLFSFHLRLKQPDVYPIKTYIDYGLDKDPKEEFKVDPMATLVEMLGNIKPTEKVWIQILIRAHLKHEWIRGDLATVADWKDDISAIVDKIAQREKGHDSGDERGNDLPRVTPGERDLIAALERSRGKYAFNTQIRIMYIAKEGSFNGTERIGALLTLWRNFDDFNRNQFGMSWRTDFDWNWWQDPTGWRRREYKRHELHEYKIRIMHGKHPIDKPFILTTEEIATIFHPAGRVITTPTMERVPSARSEPPANLPR